MQEPKIDLNELLSEALKAVFVQQFQPYIDEIKRLNDFIMSEDSRVTAAFERIIELEQRPHRVDNLREQVGSLLEQSQSRLADVQSLEDRLSKLDERTLTLVGRIDRTQVEMMRKVEDLQGQVWKVQARNSEAGPCFSEDQLEAIQDLINDSSTNSGAVYSQVAEAIENMAQDPDSALSQAITAEFNEDSSSFSDPVKGILKGELEDRIGEAIDDKLDGLLLTMKIVRVED